MIIALTILLLCIIGLVYTKVQVYKLIKELDNINRSNTVGKLNTGGAYWKNLAEDFRKVDLEKYLKDLEEKELLKRETGE